MSAVLMTLVVRDERGTARHALTPGRRYVLGRSAESDIVLDAPFVSRRQGELTFRAGGWMYRDRGGTNPARLGGDAVGEIRLHLGDRLEIRGREGESITFELAERRPGDRRGARSPTALIAGGAALVVALIVVGIILVGTGVAETDSPGVAARAATPGANASPTSARATGTPAFTVAACEFADSAAAVLRGTVFVETETGSGSGFSVGGSLFVTAAHVVDGARWVTLKSERGTFDAEIIESNVAVDVALLRSNMPATALSWAGTTTLRGGEPVGVSGYPFDFTEGGGPAVVRGVFSRSLSVDGVRYLQTDAPVNPGNSGGPIFDECGGVLGVMVNRPEEVGGRRVEGIALAVSSETTRASLAGLR